MGLEFEFDLESHKEHAERRCERISFLRSLSESEGSSRALGFSTFMKHKNRDSSNVLRPESYDRVLVLFQRSGWCTMSLTRFCTDVVSRRGHSRPVLGVAYSKIIGRMQGSEFNVCHIVLESRSCLKGRGRSDSTLFAARTSLDLEIAHLPRAAAAPFTLHAAF